MRLLSRVIAYFALVCVSGNASAFLGAFWLGVDAKVETNVKIDQRVLDMMNALPAEVRKQAVLAANEVIDKLDEKFKENLPLISAEVEKVSLTAAIQWECTGKNVVDKFFSDLKGTLPRWNIFADTCERIFVPDKVGPGPAEKVKIAECWVYEALSENSSPSVIATKLSNLELMSADAACRLRETQAGPQMWKESTDFGLRFSTWSTLRNSCSNPKACFAVRNTSVSALLNSSDTRDIGDAKERLASGQSKGGKAGCNLQCYEGALVDIYLAESEVGRNRRLRENNAKKLAEKATKLVTDAKDRAIKARDAAKAFNTLPQHKDLSAASRKALADARSNNRDSIATSQSVSAIVALVDRDANLTDSLLAESDKLAAETLAAELKRQEDARRSSEEFRARMLQERMDRNPWSR